MSADGNFCSEPPTPPTPSSCCAVDTSRMYILTPLPCTCVCLLLLYAFHVCWNSYLLVKPYSNTTNNCFLVEIQSAHVRSRWVAILEQQQQQNNEWLYFIHIDCTASWRFPPKNQSSAINSANVVLWSWDVLGYLHVFNVLLSVWTYVQHALAAGRASIDFVVMHYANACMHSEWLLHQCPTTQYTYYYTVPSESIQTPWLFTHFVSFSLILKWIK
jgi:hypothetical protein